jgi:hypothetical protein
MGENGAERPSPTTKSLPRRSIFRNDGSWGDSIGKNLSAITTQALVYNV